MTEPAPEQPTPELTDTDAPVESADDVELPQDLEAAKKLRSEAANLRRRNRELEADNERLITQTAAWQRREIERTAGRDSGRRERCVARRSRGDAVVL